MGWDGTIMTTRKIKIWRPIFIWVHVAVGSIVGDWFADTMGDGEEIALVGSLKSSWIIKIL